MVEKVKYIYREVCGNCGCVSESDKTEPAPNPEYVLKSDLVKMQKDLDALYEVVVIINKHLDIHGYLNEREQE